MKPWCTEPFITLENKVWGEWGLCCRSKGLPYSAKDVSPLDHFNSDTMKRVRKDMVNHNITDEIKNLCDKCILHETRGITSRRQQKVDMEVPSMDKDGTIHDFKFNSIEVKFFGNLCNLICQMCDGRFSSSIAAIEKKKGNWTGPTHINIYEEMKDKDKFYSDMSKILPYTKLVKFTGGEPTMNKSIIKFITWIADNGFAKNLTLKIITNGTRRSDSIIKASKAFREFYVQVSVDGTFDIDVLQRPGTNFDDVIDNIREYKKHSYVGLGPVITALNVGDVPNLDSFAKSMGVPLDLSSIVMSPPHMRIEVLPIEYRQRLLKEYDYPKEIRTALEDTFWDKEQFNVLLKLNPNLYDYLLI